MKKIKLILFAALVFSGAGAKAQNNLSCDSAKLISYNPVNGIGTSFNNLVDGTPVWFSFIASSSSMEVLIKNTTDTSFFQAEITVLYSGTCNTLVKIAADSIDCQTDTTLGIVYSNLVVGQTYRIEVIKGSTTFACRTCQQNGNTKALFDLYLRSVAIPPVINYSCNSIPACNLVNNGGFETGAGCGPIGTTYVDGLGNVYQPGILSCWRSVGPSVSADILTRNCVPPSGGLNMWVVPVGPPFFSSTPTLDTWNGAASNNNSMIGMAGVGPKLGTYNEGVVGQLNTTLTSQGGPYVLSFYARESDVNSNAHNKPVKVEFSFSNANPPVQANYSSAGFPITLTFTLTSTFSPFALFTSAPFTVPSGPGMNYIIIGNAGLTVADPLDDSYVFIDDVQINVVPPTITVTNNNPKVCNGEILTNLAQYVTTQPSLPASPLSFSGPGIVPVPSTGTYNFDPAVAGGPGNYTITATYTHIVNSACTLPPVTATFTVTVKPTVNTLTPVATPIQCVGQFATLSVAGCSSNTFLTWFSGTVPATGTPVVATPTAPTTYTVICSDPSLTTCPRGTVTVTPQFGQYCCQPPNFTINSGVASSTLGATLPTSNSLILVSGLFIINTPLNFTNCKFRMAANSRINIAQNVTVNFTGCEFFSCTQMWDGIYLGNNGAVSATVNFSGGALEDAINGVVANSNGSPLPCNFTLRGMSMNKNQTSLKVENCGAVTYYPAGPSNITSNDFSCHTSLNSPGGTLKTPNANTRSKQGIYVLSLRDIVIGDINTGLNGGNTFTNLDYGIAIDRAYAKIYNNQFSMLGRLTPSCSGCMPIAVGVGIYTIPNNFPKLNNTRVFVGDIFNFTYQNTFTNCFRAIDGGYCTEFNIARNVVTNTFTSNASFAITNTLAGNTGFFLKAATGPGSEMNENHITNCKTGIQWSRNFGNTSILATAELDAQNNTLDVTGSGFMDNGIAIGDPIANFSSMYNGGVKVRDNDITDARKNAITATNIQTGFVIKSNTIHMNLLSAGTRNGILVQGCQWGKIANNNIFGAFTNPLTEYGININNSTNNSVFCNYEQIGGTCLRFSGNCMSATTGGIIVPVPAYSGPGMIGNKFVTGKRGLELTNAGVLGTQGSATEYIDDAWLASNLFPNGATYTSGTPATLNANALSKLFVKSNVPYNPTAPGLLNLAAGSSTPYNATGINVISSPPPGFITCPAPVNLATSSSSGTSYWQDWQQNTAPNLNNPQQVLSNYRILLHDLVTDTTVYPVYNDETKWMRMQFVFRTLKDNPLLIPGFPDLHTVHGQAQGMDVNKIEKVNDKILNGQFSAALALNNSITPENHAAQTQKELNKILIHQLNNPGTMNPADSVQLINLATDCPLYGGLAVYQSRLLYNQLYNDYFSFDDGNCIDLTSARLKSGNTSDETQNNLPRIKLFPNPSSGMIFLETDGLTENAKIEIYTIEGRLLKSKQLVSDQKNYSIDLSDVQPGMYLFYLKQGDTILKNEKIILLNDK